MPVIKFPTNQDDLGNRAVEAGVILPLAIQLPGDWDLGTMVQVNYVQDSESSDYHAEVIESITVGHDIVGELAGYVELFSNLSTERARQLDRHLRCWSHLQAQSAMSNWMQA